MLCEICQNQKPSIKRPRTQQAICKECFYDAVEMETHQTIISTGIFNQGERVAIAASGGKDSTVLIHLMTTLNERYGYGLDLFLLAVDEGIAGYRDDSLVTVQHNSEFYSLPLHIVSYKELYGWTMDEIVATIGKNGNCTYCGVFRRQALDKGARMANADKIVTGHNADDMAETVIMNFLRGDAFRLAHCTEICSGDEGSMPRYKPLKYIYEKEIVLYAHFKNLEYFSTECIYSPNAYRGYARELLKDLERVHPPVIHDIIQSGEQIQVEATTAPTRTTCQRCGSISSNSICKACKLLDVLSNLGLRAVESQVNENRVEGCHYN